MKRVCMSCNVFEDEHDTFIRWRNTPMAAPYEDHDPDWMIIPDGCVCYWGDWDLYTMENRTLPQVCDNYSGLRGSGDGRRCLNCGHEHECHGTL